MKGVVVADYRITVRRTNTKVCEGVLEFFVDGMSRFSTPCWEDPGNLIEAKTYTGCSTTTMFTKGFKSVYLPDEQTGKKGIFIHQGSKPSHSDGCIVCAAGRVAEIFDEVPRNGRNITVVVS